MTRRLVATFDREDRLLAAVAGARERGWPLEDVYTPYPVHGIDDAMGIRPTRLGVVCFLLGLAGVLLASAVQYWTHAVDWPINVGGRPMNAWPAYVPVSFEVMVLLAGVGTVLAFLAVARLYPGRRAAVVDPRATDDRFVVVVEARGEAVETDLVLEYFRKAGALSVEDREPGAAVARCGGAGKFLVAGLGLLLALLVAGAWIVRHDPRNPNDKWMADMANPVSYTAYAEHPDLPGGRVMQPGQPGTIARGRMPFRYAATPEDAERAGRELAFPYPMDDAAVQQRGAKVWQNYCMVCHGLEGAGDGPVTKRGVPPPPPLTGENAMRMPPGRLFHVATLGQGNMPSHAGQIPEEDRWAVVRHVLNLQKR